MRRTHGALGGLALAAAAAAFALALASSRDAAPRARGGALAGAPSPAERVRALAARPAPRDGPATRRADHAGARSATLRAEAAAAEPAEARGEHVRDSSLLWPRLDPSSPEAGSLTTRVSGHDPVGARGLVLYAHDAVGAHALARTTSDADGRFDFGHLPQPNAGLLLVVTALGGDPLAPSPLDRAAGALPPPQLASSDDEGALVLSIHPALLAGELLLVDDGGRVLRRVAAVRSPEVLRLDAVAAADTLAVVHRLPDGREAVALAAVPAP